MSTATIEPTNGITARTKLSKMARKRLERFVTLFPKVLVSDAPETIHDLRVASRRLQQALRLVLPSSKSSGVRKLMRIPRKVRRAFGACRNLDASLALVDKKLAAAATASLRQSWDNVRLWLEQKRWTELERARRQLKHHDLIDFIARVQARLEGIDLEPERIGKFEERARDAFAAWKETLAFAKTNPEVKQIHTFRIAGKRLRYRTESLAELGDTSVKRLVQGLKGLQDDLGEWHDRCVLRQHVAEFIGRPGFLAEEPGMCRGLLLEMERDKQRDHAALNDVITKAERLAESGPELNSSEQSEEKAIKIQ